MGINVRVCDLFIGLAFLFLFLFFLIRPSLHVTKFSIFEKLSLKSEKRKISLHSQGGCCKLGSGCESEVTVTAG